MSKIEQINMCVCIWGVGRDRGDREREKPSQDTADTDEVIWLTLRQGRCGVSGPTPLSASPDALVTVNSLHIVVGIANGNPRGSASYLLSLQAPFLRRFMSVAAFCHRLCFQERSFLGCRQEKGEHSIYQVRADNIQAGEDAGREHLAHQCCQGLKSPFIVSRQTGGIIYLGILYDHYEPTVTCGPYAGSFEKKKGMDSVIPAFNGLIVA